MITLSLVLSCYFIIQQIFKICNVHNKFLAFFVSTLLLGCVYHNIKSQLIIEPFMIYWGCFFILFSEVLIFYLECTVYSSNQ